MALAKSVSGKNMKSCKKRHPTFSVEGTIIVVSHVFYMTGKDSKYFFIELQMNKDSDIDHSDVSFVLARVRNLEKSILNLQINRSSSDSLIGKRYYIIMLNNQLNVSIKLTMFRDESTYTIVFYH